ncbi:hypothetical protein ACFL6F_02710 [Planctomycetota bacterium]
MPNLQNTEIDYLIKENEQGIWRSYVYESGKSFREYRSKTEIMGLPLIHFTYGKCPETGRRIVAKGFIAVGRLSCGVIAIGHASLGLIAFGQLALGALVFAQAAFGLVGLGQLAIMLVMGIGQIATGYVAIGQVVFGYYVLGQIGWGVHAWTMGVRDPEAYKTFKWIIDFFIKK